MQSLSNFWSVKKNRLTLLFLIVSFVMAYCSYWVPAYIKIFHPSEISILGSLKKFTVNCAEDPKDSTHCSDEYIIQKSFLPTEMSNKSIGFGHVVTTREFGCDDKGHFKEISFAGQSASPNQIYQTPHITHVVPLGLFSQCSNSIALKTWVANGDFRHGANGGLVTVGDTNIIELQKKLIEFLLISLPQNMGFIALIFFFLFTKYFSVVGMKKDSRAFFSLAPYWFATFLFTSGLAQIILPIDNYFRIFSRVGCFFSMLSHFALGAYFFARDSRIESIRKAIKFLVSPGFNIHQDSSLALILTPLGLFLGLVCASPFYYPAFSIISAAFGLTFLIVGPKKDFTFVCFSFCYVGALLSHFNIEYSPRSNVTFYFVAFSFSYEIYLMISREFVHFIHGLLNSSPDESVVQAVHDIRSPIGALKLFLSQLHWSDDNQDIRVGVNSALDRMSSISKGLLEKRQIRNLDQNYFISKDSIDRLVNEVRLLHPYNSFTYSACLLGQNLNSRLPSEVFERVIQNLLSNAFEAKLVKKIIMNVVQSNESDFSVMIENDGESIPPHILEKIMTVGGTYGKENGNGLGVHYARVRVEEAGGQFSLVSKDNKTVLTIHV